MEREHLKQSEHWFFRFAGRCVRFEISASPCLSPSSDKASKRGNLPVAPDLIAFLVLLLGWRTPPWQAAAVALVRPGLKWPTRAWCYSRSNPHHKGFACFDCAMCPHARCGVRIAQPIHSSFRHRFNERERAHRNNNKKTPLFVTLLSFPLALFCYFFLSPL